MCVNSVIIHVFTEMNYRCNYMQFLKKIYKYNVQTCLAGSTKEAQILVNCFY